MFSSRPAQTAAAAKLTVNGGTHGEKDRGRRGGFSIKCLLEVAQHTSICLECLNVVDGGRPSVSESLCCNGIVSFHLKLCKT